MIGMRKMKMSQQCSPITKMSFVSVNCMLHFVGENVVSVIQSIRFSYFKFYIEHFPRNLTDFVRMAMWMYACCMINKVSFHMLLRFEKCKQSEQ